MLKSKHTVTSECYQNITVFGDEIFIKVIKLK